MTITKLIRFGIGISTTTYYKLMYIIYADDECKYGVVHIAVFGRN